MTQPAVLRVAEPWWQKGRPFGSPARAALLPPAGLGRTFEQGFPETLALNQT